MNTNIFIDVFFLKSASTNKLHLLNFSITVKERMADDEVKWEATSSGQTTLFFFFFLFHFRTSPHSSPPSKSNCLPTPLPVPMLSSCQSENGKQNNTPFCTGMEPGCQMITLAKMSSL